MAHTDHILSKLEFNSTAMKFWHKITDHYLIGIAIDTLIDNIIKME